MLKPRSVLALILSGALAVTVALYSPIPACAQVGTASLSGTITDPSGAAVPNVKVTLNGLDRTFTRSTVTSASGEYVLPALQPGRYSVRLTASGFATYETELFALSSGEGRALNLTLHLATQQSRVTVQASAPLLQTTSASIGSTVSSRQFTDLPILGRSFLNLISLEPGTVPIAPTGSTTNHNPTGQSVMPSVFGQRQKDNNSLLDGVENRDPNLLGVALYPPPGAIAEMKIDSGVGSAIYGHASGAVIDVVTKSGTNEWHGDGWEYLRNNALDARSFFTPQIGAFHWNQFGADVGGPLVIPHPLSKNKAWYIFGYYEGVRIHNAANFETLVPTTAEMQGDFTGFERIYDPYSTAPGPNKTFTRTQVPNNVIPASEMNATSVKLAHIIFPAPNLTGITGVKYINTAGDVTDGNQWDVRADHEFGQHDNFFARYSAANNPSYGVSVPSLKGSQADRLE
ncbi:MAG: carboxypeptidase regulatory-like domain-containing protein [Terriglobia bacterium]